MAVQPISVAHLNAILPVKPLEWHQTDEALDLLCRIDAYERSSDAWAGHGDQGIAAHFAADAIDAGCELDCLRFAAIKAVADATGVERYSPAWDHASDEADEAMPSVDAALAEARRRGFGDGLIEQAGGA